MMIKIESINYATALNQIKDCDCFLFEGTGCVSKFIQHWTLSRKTHAGVACWARGRLFVLEAREGRGVQMVPLEVYLRRGVIVDWYKLSDDQIKSREAGIDEAISHVYKPYASVWQFLRSWGIISPKIADWLDIPANVNVNRFHCSGYYLKIIRAAGYTGESWREPARTSPGDIAELPCLNRRLRIINQPPVVT
jgi:hypothetical protein